MSETNFISKSRIAILGMGLMGGSLALALRGHCSILLGYDPDPKAVSIADQRNVVDQATTDLPTILPQADVVVLAAPVKGILELIQNLPGLHPGAAIVLDLGSTKTKIVQAMANLPARFDPFGGHPMCGKEKLSLVNAEGTLFKDASFAFTPLERTSQRARTFANQLAHTIGAHPIWLDPHTHDRWTAATSHLPYMVSAALALATPKNTKPLIGPGFLSTTRLAATPSSMMLDVLITNKANTLEALERFRKNLDLFEEHLQLNDRSGLKDLLDQSAVNRNALAGDHGKAGTS